MKVPFNKITAPYIDFSDWSLPALEEALEGVIGAFEQVIEEACQEGATVWLPFVFSTFADDGDGEGGPTIFDPLVMRVGVPLGGNEDDMPSWDVDLGALIESEIARLDGEWSDDDMELLTRMRDRLAGLVALVDKQIGALKRQ